MAESRSKTREAAALLRRAASILNNDLPVNDTNEEELSNNTNNNINNNEVSRSVVPNNRSITPGIRPFVHEEFRRLFAPYNSNAANSHRAQIHQPPAKRSRGNSWGTTRYFKPHDTWTHDFFCLSNRQQRCVPTRVEKSRLQKAGLGRKRISFHKNADASKVKTSLENTFPKLALSGGFELLRSSATPRDLEVIAPPNSGYSVPFLRDSSGLGQAIAYIRPVQKDLDTTPLVQEDCFGDESISVRQRFIYLAYCLY